MKALLASLLLSTTFSALARVYDCTTSKEETSARVKITNFSQDFSVIEMKTEGALEFSANFNGARDPRWVNMMGKVQVAGDEEIQEARPTGNLQLEDNRIHLALYVQDRRIEHGFGFHMNCR